jgi:hypothetical protein
MRPSLIVAVDHVDMEGPPGAEADLVWLYRDVVGLQNLAWAETSAGLRFRSGNIELRYHLLSAPATESVACRLTVEVPSVIEVARQFEDRSWSFQWLRGLSRTDRRLSFLDPGGNRVEIKQHWPWWF